MNHFLKYSFFTLLVCGLISCKKKADSTLGTDVQDEGDALFSIISDTASFEMHTVDYDSTRSFQDQFKYIGSNQDPVFGRTSAEIFTNFSMPNSVSNISFGEDAVLDSAELILTFTQSFVGDSTTALRYQVHQITQALDKTKAYYTDNTVPFSSSLLTDVMRRTTKTGSFYTIRLPLNHTFAEAILNNPAYLTSNSVFQSTYKGFYITTKNSALSSSAQGALMKVDLDNPTSGVYLYYHNGGPSSSKEPKSYRFPFSGTDASRFNYIQYDPVFGGNSSLVQQLIANDSTYGKQNIFIKGLGGAKTVIRLPFLKNYSDSCPISVNRAELIFKVDQSFTTTVGTYDPPNKISLVACDSKGAEIYVKDQFYSADIVRFGGSYDAVNKQYVFNFARHIQDIMSGKLGNYGFYLVVADPDRFAVARRDDKAERAIFGGINNALYKPTFKLTYVRFPYDK
ncbi:MAG: DUF4270 family protein [Sphingobacteriaceae bacterium]|nr:DUF4270 family protein [Sphingobacteriaceae bacterium]